LRVSGTVGTYYGAPQIGATAAVITAHGRAITPLVVRSGPIVERLEWRLVRVSGTIRSVERDGKAWRLDVALTSGAVPVHGETRAAIPSTKLNKGARVTVTGIVRRPRTTAADRRFALIPRGTADVLIATAGTRGGSARSATANGTATRGSNGADSVPPAGGSDVVDVDLARLGAYEGQLVRVGGLLVARAGVRLTLRDASGSADARLPASASALVSELVPGEALNVTGRVRKAGQARWEVVAETPGDIARVGSLEVLGSVTSRPNQSATAAAGAPTRYPGAPAAAAPDRWLGPGPLGTAGLVPPALLLLGVASAGLWAVGLYFRRRVPPDGPGGS
jgi:RNase P/RNase MRP subunit POP5